MSGVNILPGAHSLIVDVDWLLTADFDSLIGDFKFLCERTGRLFVRETERTWDDAVIEDPDLEVWTEYVVLIPSAFPAISDFFEQSECYSWTRTNLLLTDNVVKCGGTDLVYATTLEEYCTSNAEKRIDRSIHLDGSPLTSWSELLSYLPLDDSNSLMLVDWHLFQDDGDYIPYFEFDEITGPIQNVIDVVSTLGTNSAPLNILICMKSQVPRIWDRDHFRHGVLDDEFFHETGRGGRCDMVLNLAGMIELQIRLSKTLSEQCNRTCKVELIGHSRPPKSVIHNRPICTEHWSGWSDIGWNWFHRNELRQNHVNLEHSYNNLVADSVLADSSLSKWLSLFLSLEKLWKRYGSNMTCVNSDGEIVETWSEMNHPLLPKLN